MSHPKPKFMCVFNDMSVTHGNSLPEVNQIFNQVRAQGLDGVVLSVGSNGSWMVVGGSYHPAQKNMIDKQVREMLQNYDYVEDMAQRAFMGEAIPNMQKVLDKHEYRRFLNLIDQMLYGGE